MTPEGKFKSSFRRAMSEEGSHLYHCSLADAAMGAPGIPDKYIDGPRFDLWVEFKALVYMPRDNIVVPGLTALQKIWLQRRWTNGKNAIVATQLPNKLIVLQKTPPEWLNGTSVLTAISMKDFVQWVITFCGK